MCGICGQINLNPQNGKRISERELTVMSNLIAHRGPDDSGQWISRGGTAGLGHRRLSIIDISSGHQPMIDDNGNCISYNGEVYNYIEIRDNLQNYNYATSSDTEVILKAYSRWGNDCVSRFRGMFAFALWDEKEQALFCARDRFGIKPFYYLINNDIFYFASEAKALLPFVDNIETDTEGLKDYLTFQFCLDGKTLFKGIKELLPGHTLTVKDGNVSIRRYWQVYYDIDWYHSEKYFEERIQEHLMDSVKIHLRSDVPLGAYVSGGIDSSLIASMAGRNDYTSLLGLTGKFLEGPEYDESHYARMVAEECNFPLYEKEITVDDFIGNIRKVIFHLDYPVAGPGSFPQYMVSELAARHRKVVLGGQGGDEIFGGYIRYLVSYFEQCIKAAIDGTMNSGNFIVTYESIIPNLVALKNYKPMLQEFWREGLFEDLDRRYFHLINRAPALGDEIRWELLEPYSAFQTFQKIFKADNVEKESYFDSMTHFDFKTLLPALLQVEDRVSMAHGMESRVPFLDHPLVELAATIPSNIKFKNGSMKRVLKSSMKEIIPDPILNRTDKMGFPVPLHEWMKGDAYDFILDVFTCGRALNRDFVDNKKVSAKIRNEARYGRTLWGLLCLEIWQQEFHDKNSYYKNLLN